MEKGIEVAETLPTNETMVKQQLQSLDDIESHIIQQVTSSLTQAVTNSNNELKQMLEDIQTKLESDNEASETQLAYTDLQNEYNELGYKHEDLKEEYEILSNSFENAEEELNKLQNMSIWKFRKWKKN
ncbi:hypothetical protein [Staphylococcus simiae]|uniref:hypothetical protein n=1 Tax=Staphylococcus simiae TaxID=308354 RepID=UPI001A96BB6F|nr:hypothetical protein [Staphylococcus simiae]MBO1228925.1 hypothetical protein [Staphylococcus simiae]QSY53947.1 hypothetical protein J3R86_00215 [Staphylococcus simiae]